MWTSWDGPTWVVAASLEPKQPWASSLSIATCGLKFVRKLSVNVESSGQHMTMGVILRDLCVGVLRDVGDCICGMYIGGPKIQVVRRIPPRLNPRP